jgi:hypothetical protein
LGGWGAVPELVPLPPEHPTRTSAIPANSIGGNKCIFVSRFLLMGTTD